MVRILVTDDHSLLRSGLRLLLDREDDLEVVGEATTAEDAIERTADGDVDLVLMEVCEKQLVPLGSCEDGSYLSAAGRDAAPALLTLLALAAGGLWAMGACRAP